MSVSLSPDTNELTRAPFELADNYSCCYQCGVCINSCPVGAINSRFNPRLIMHKLSLGLVKELLASKEIWLCSQCYACQERCPQGIAISDLIIALRNLSFSTMGKTMPHYNKILQNMRNYGGLYELDDFVNDDREMLGLPFKEHNNKDLKVILDKDLLKKI